MKHRSRLYKFTLLITIISCIVTTTSSFAADTILLSPAGESDIVPSTGEATVPEDITPLSPAGESDTVPSTGEATVPEDITPLPPEGESENGQSSGETAAPGESHGGIFPPGDSASDNIAKCVTESGFEYYTQDSFFRSDPARVCFILLPSDYEGNFPEDTNWAMFSRIGNFSAVYLKTDWAEADADQYYQEVYSAVNEEYLFTESLNFIIGYEDGADFALTEVCENHERYSGIAAIGGAGLTADAIDRYSRDSADWNMNIWLMFEKTSISMTKNLTFWKRINSITGCFAQMSYSVDYADQLYIPSLSLAGENLPDQQNVGVIYYSHEDDFYDESIAAKIGRYFINAITDDGVAFTDTITGGEIKSGIDSRNFTYIRHNYEGQQRDCWIYVPDKAYLTREPSSLILCLHGNYGNGEDMIFRSEWNTVAEEKNCIVLFPTALLVDEFRHDWKYSDEEMDYLRNLLETTCENYRIDKSRIYVTGFSNGAGMAQCLAVNFSDIIAAAALEAPVYWDSEFAGPPENFYSVAILYSFGTEDKYLKKYGYTANINDLPALSHLGYWKMLYRFEMDDYQYEEKGDFKMYTFTNNFGVPVVRWVTIEGKGHTYPKEEVPAIYDFLHAYTKDENGVLYYNGIPVLSEASKTH